jgi:muramoyltetrapeptide carboxypeptidase
LKPVFLKPGAALGLVFPASPVSKPILEKGVGILERFDFNIRRSDLTKKKTSYLAASDVERLYELTSTFNSPNVDAVLAARGGYGCLRLLPNLDWSRLPATKPLLGYSDLTALHLSRLAHTGQGGWHAPVASSYVNYAQSSVKKIVATLHGRGPENWSFPARDVLQEGQASGPLVGGNLTLINCLLSTDHLPNLSGAILLLEDINELNYRLDRELTTLWLSGKLKDLSGLVFGSFVNCGLNASVNSLLSSFTKNCLPSIPVVKGAPFGHGKLNNPWWYGEEAELTVGRDRAHLTFLERVSLTK